LTTATAYAISRGLIAGALAVVLAWDAFAYLRYGDGATISHWFWTTAQARPWFAPAVGALFAGLWVHFFWGYWRAS